MSSMRRGTEARGTRELRWPAVGVAVGLDAVHALTMWPTLPQRWQVTVGQSAMLCGAWQRPHHLPEAGLPEGGLGGTC